MKKPPYRAYRKKEKKKEELPVHLPEKIDTPEAEQLVSDLYRIAHFLSANWKKIAGALLLFAVIAGSYGGYVWQKNQKELKAARIVDEGLYFLRSGNEKKATELFSKALKEYKGAPSTKIAAFLLAKIEKKEELLRELSKTDSFLVSPPSKTGMVAAEIDKNDLDAAQKIISQIKRDKDWTYPEAIYDRLLIALKKGDSESAKDALETLKGDYPNLPITTLARRIAE
ncbi:hypothetical protein [Phorcysia thermohydrogeniphila]|uniref:Tetratricopeptide repeat-like domain-containing protein n=1 Tax=Phorcysia thermohydrogeniphila TaxID=936138 RepID=A0A4V2PDW7_9BACT|nr:hypothetical protein [Phorcysia thermohydrogeniphila]TCK06546.1 hypothetical protein CLV27_0348 [Phorcysia thermohydrogeniphila]